MTFKIIILLSLIFTVNHSYSQTNNIDSDMKEIIKYGTYAPSSHNAQMWSVKIINNQKIKVFPNDKRVLPYVDPQNRETWISIGAFVENCVLSAKDMGYNPTVKINDSDLIIDITKHKEIKSSTKNINNILRRLTIRTPYLNEKIDDKVIKEIIEISENVFFYPKETSQGKEIIDNSIKAYSLQMQDTNKLKELSKWMTFSYKEEKERKDGLTPDMLGIKGFKHFLFNTFMSKKSVTSKSFIKGSIKVATKQLNSCSGFIIITSKSNSISELVNTGRILESVWLKCVENEIAVHPMSQVIEENDYYELLKAGLKIKGEIQMVLRIGKVKHYPERTGRRVSF
jgi:hypothetical protein